MPPNDWSDIPVVPNREILIGLPRVYTQKSIHAGSMLDVRLNSPSPYQLSIARLGWDFDSPSQDWILQSLPQAPAIQRSIRPGSYIHIGRALVSDGSYPQLTIECWVRLFRTTSWQGLITQYTMNP